MSTLYPISSLLYDPRYSTRISQPKLYGRTIPFGPYTPEDLEKARRQFPEEKLASRALEKLAYANWCGSSSNKWFWKNNYRYTCGDEILDSIFGFALITKDLAVFPDVSTSNKVQKYEDPKFHQNYTLGGRVWEDQGYVNMICHDALDLSTIIQEQRYDAQGKYIVIRRVFRPVIDATLLRVCRSICDQATKLLYAGNEFQFLATKTGKLGAPDSLFEDKFYPNSSSIRDFCQGRDDQEAVDVRERAALDAINIIENRTPVLDLDCDMYHDLFVRFLRAIGPSKSAMIKTLHFGGTIKAHHCSQESSCGKVRKYCEDDLIESLLLYIPLIKRFCTNLQKLVINIMSRDRDTSDSFRSGPTQFKHDERELQSYARLQALLETQIRGLSTVQQLQIYDEDHEKVDCARDTEAWFSERTRRRGLEALEQAKLQSRMEALDIGNENASSSVETSV
ncbi:hypothetical protein BcDW1_3976 [Botrytis cinerea BcDW1]|uniref:Uncharacterized protein n=1 Tax=Botryotinia fuckeliana (strain BcDW1) TaxID=1290391 RepID=M7UU68_BOTF1|nr:hypothetical protein BcDW1_3976 [Botrytis cinerea BcDW1]